MKFSSIISLCFLVSLPVCWAKNPAAENTPTPQSTNASTKASTIERLAPSLLEQAKLPIKSASAETLYAVTESTLYEDGHWLRRYYLSIRLNDLDAARDYGRLAIRFNHYYSEMELEYANTLSSGGKIIALSDDALQNRVTGGGQDFYSDSSELVFSLPDVSPGTILEFQYVKKSKTLAFPALYSAVSIPHWFQTTAGNDSWRADFVHHYRYTFTYPKQQTVHVQAVGGHTQKAKKTHTANTTTLTWKMRNIAEVVSEHWFPRKEKIYPELEISTMVDWANIDRWTWEKVADKLVTNESIEEAVRSLKLKPTASKEEKIKAVYTYVQNNIRYVFAHLGRGGYEPHFPAEVIHTRYGDCKDQTVLTVAMLRALGLQAYPALVETPRAGYDATSVVKLIFDHMIVYLPAQDGMQELWLDTTGDRSLYPGMSAYLAEQNAMIIDGKGGRLTHIPQPENDNRVLMTIDYSLSHNGLTQAHITLQPQGSFEQDMRSWWINDSDRRQSLDRYLKGIFNNALDYEVSGELNNSDDIFTPVNISGVYTFQASNAEDAKIQGASIKQLLNIFADTSNLPLPENRVNTFYNPYAYTLEVKARFQRQDSDIPALIQSSGDIHNPFFSLTQSGEGQEHAFLYNARFTQKVLDLSVKDYGEYYQQAQDLNRLKPWMVSLTPSVESEKQQEIANIQETFGNNSVQAKIAKARQLIEKGDFEAALDQAKAAVNLDKENGEAWYVLATAQGFNTMLEQSSASFEKAEALGYLP
ncbi:hypothetical protein TDB9533_01626 [Thalassocella blandensis]|nr:hypothetical protein TDB9533_01626 [Thalassocella blandensis]